MEKKRTTYVQDVFLNDIPYTIYVNRKRVVRRFLETIDKLRNSPIPALWCCFYAAVGWILTG